MIPMLTVHMVAFCIFGLLAVAGALGMVLSRKPVHSAISLAGMMVALACLYASLDAPFLFVAQIIVYTGAVMMLFLFTMMIVGVDTPDSLVETLKGQRVAAVIFALGLAVLLILAVGNGIVTGNGGLEATHETGNVRGVAQLIFGQYVFAFEFTSALIMVAALAAIVLAHGEKLTKPESQPERARRVTREFGENGKDPGPLPGPGVYARNNSIQAPGLLPDGSVAQKSVSPTLEVRGVAVVENDSLRAPHRAALTKFIEVVDENTGGDHASQASAELADPGRGDPPAIGKAGSESSDRSGEPGAGSDDASKEK